MIENKGLFIAFEGIDGSGKTTQLKRFVEYLFYKDKHNHIILTREPYKETKIRKLLREGTDPLSQASLIANLFINDRKQHVEELILPSLEKGFHVVTDRYKLSTIAYQSAQGMDVAELIRKHVNLPVPNMTFIMDIPAKKAFARMSGESGRDPHKFESNIEFLEKIRKQFIQSQKSLPKERIFVINGDRDAEQIFNEIISIFEKEISNPPAKTSRSLFGIFRRY
ncbi:MAG: dTMP kinase [Nanoarchaeota archaeon]|nr:dTMP kinase [Nanoarchaeota archaeon]